MPEIAKIGDIVVCVEGRVNLTVGEKYKVKGLTTTNSGLCYKITGDGGTGCCLFYAQRFKICESSPTASGAVEYEEAMAARDIMDNL